MSVRIPDEIHDRLANAARSRHMSVNAALVQAAEQWITQQARDRVVADAMDDVFAADADLFSRLADA